MAIKCDPVGSELHGLGSSINCPGRRVASYTNRDAKNPLCSGRPELRHGLPDALAEYLAEVGDVTEATQRGDLADGHV